MALPETFTGTNGTTLTAYNALWVSNAAHTGVMEIQSNKAVLRSLPAESACYLYDQQPASADYKVSATVNAASSVAVFGVVGRADKTASTFYQARYSGGFLQIYKFVNGTPTQIGGVSAETLTLNTDHVLELDMTGTTIRLLWNGTQRVSATDSAISATGYGGVRVNSGGTGLKFDNFDVSNMGGGSTSLIVADSAHAHTADNIALSVLGTLVVQDATHAHSADNITLTATASGTITIPAVRDWETGNLKTGQTGVQVDIRNIATGALVVRKTGQTTHGTTGVCVVTDALIVSGTTYEVVTRFADGSRGMWDYLAS